MIARFVKILPTNTTIAARYMSTLSFCPNNVSNIASIAFPKNTVMKIVKLKFFFNVANIQPNTESNAAIIAIAKYPEYVYDTIGANNPISAPTMHPTIIAINIILLLPPACI